MILSEYFGLTLLLSFHQCSILSPCHCHSTGCPYSILYCQYHSTSCPYSVLSCQCHSTDCRFSILFIYSRCFIFWLLTSVKEYCEKGRRRIWACYFKNDVHKSEESKTVNALLSRLFFYNYSNSPEKSGCLPSFLSPSYVSRKTRIDCVVKTLLTGFTLPSFLYVSRRLTIIPWEYFK